MLLPAKNFVAPRPTELSATVCENLHTADAPDVGVDDDNQAEITIFCLHNNKFEQLPPSPQQNYRVAVVEHRTSILGYL